MTGDRRDHSHDAATEAGATAAAGPRQRRRDPAKTQFRRVGGMNPEATRPVVETAAAVPCRFEVYRTDQVSTNSTQFSGGDWHWRLCDQTGRTLVDAGGYRNERACREAVSLLKERAATAIVAPTT